MKKRTIAIAVAGAMFTAGSAFAADVTVDGFAEIQWNITNELDENTEGQFAVTETEVNFDTDHLFVAATASEEDGFSIGQAFAKYAITDGWNLKAGKFDSNLTADYGSAPDREFVQHSLLFNVLDSDSTGIFPTTIGGASLTGVAVTGDLGGMATVTLGYGNDTSVDTATDEGENSIMLLVNASPVEGLDLELGFLTQDDEVGAGLGNIVDINGTYTIQGFTVGLDYMQGSENEGIFDNGYSAWVGYNFGNGFNVKGRFENVSRDGGDDLEATELYASYDLNDNLAVAVSLYNVDGGANDADINTIQLVGKF
ncbi:MAG: outer membrane beta-barrel protein [Gammaproteobacteria bacterium]|nr:outer membrane beta-barrel protein [Gammaproteobacteria bacterium]